MAMKRASAVRAFFNPSTFHSSSIFRLYVSTWPGARLAVVHARSIYNINQHTIEPAKSRQENNIYYHLAPTRGGEGRPGDGSEGVAEYERGWRPWRRTHNLVGGGGGVENGGGIGGRGGTRGGR